MTIKSLVFFFFGWEQETHVDMRQEVVACWSLETLASGDLWRS